MNRLNFCSLAKGLFPYDRRRSRIAGRRSHNVLRSPTIIWKHIFVIVSDPAILIADDRTRSQKIAEDRTIFYLLQSIAIICDQLRSCDHMETKVLRFTTKTYPIIFWIPTHDSILLSNKARIFSYSTRLFVVNMAGVEQGKVSMKEFKEDLTWYECVYHRNS